MSAVQKILRYREQDRYAINQDSPVHARSIRVRRRTKEMKDECHAQEAERQDIHRDSQPSRYLKPRRREWLPAELARKHCSNDGKVAGKQTSGRHGRNDVERCGGNNDDERNGAGEAECDIDRVCWNAGAVDLREKGVEGQVFVASEGKDLTGGRCNLIDGAKEVPFETQSQHGDADERSRSERKEHSPSGS